MSDRRESAYPSFKTPSQYIREKVKILEKDFLIKVTPDELRHLRELKTEEHINRACQTIIISRWDNEK